jgi:hypothetical protein
MISTNSSTASETATPPDTKSVLSSKDELDHAWRYFELHAGQRMSMFHYFLIVFGLAAAGLAGCLRASGALTLVGAVLSLVLVVISYTFYKLDQRTAFLIKHVEALMQELENTIPGHTIRVFASESESTASARAMRNLWTYGFAFRFVFIVSGCVGMLGAVLALIMFLAQQK